MQLDLQARNNVLARGEGLEASRHLCLLLVILQPLRMHDHLV